jgi:glutathione synthase/RimK-type ligase-like ATP-grasp enzyme
MRVLVPTYPQDIHARSVALALEDRGHEVCLWYGADFPTRQSSSFSLEDGVLLWQVEGNGLSLDTEKFDVVWLRRPIAPVLPDDMHPGDRIIAHRECMAFYRGFMHLVAPDAFWVNPLASQERARAKPVQLVEAVRAGLLVPPTLCSNDPGQIRSFLRKFPGEVVFKGFSPAQWTREDGISFLYTTAVSEEDLPDDDVLRLSPGIFQRRIEKDCELRVTFMGDHAVTAKLLSQEIDASRVDWRAALGGVPVLPAELPEPVDRACREVMRRLGIVFGCFDFIVTPQGEHVFLELNEMGQFLWIEEENPEIRVLAPFCELLAQARPDFAWSPERSSLSFADVRDRGIEINREETPRHVPKPRYHEVQDAPDPASCQ